jgi:iron complex outermembrane receptor protein
MANENAGGFRMMSFRVSSFIFVATALASMVAVAPVAAESQEIPDETKLEEVVVTAQKREERLQDVPIAITAITADQIADRDINNIGDLSKLAPNLMAISNASNNSKQVSIRGSVQQNPALFWDSTVGIYIDGVYVGKSPGNAFDVLDLQRIEVLRGPQGTLYGRNTLAGAVNFVTRQPTGEFGGDATIRFGNFNLREAKASLDLPKWGIASTSLAALSVERDGTTKTTPGSAVRELDSRNSTSARFALNLDFSDIFQAAYRFDYGYTDEAPRQSYLSRANPSVLPFLQPYVVDHRAERVGIDAATFVRNKSQGHAVTLTWDVSASNTIKSISAYRDLRWNEILDLDGSPLLVAHTARDARYHSFSQELQLVGAANWLDYVGGLYYFKDSSFTLNPQSFFFGTANYDSRYGAGAEAWAAYGQVNYKVTDALTLTGGLRYTSEKRSTERYLAFSNGTTPFAPLIPEGTAADKTFSDTTPVLIVAYRFSNTLNAYAKYAEGFRSGGFNGEANSAVESVVPFQPVKQKSYEFGLKSSFADGRAIINAAVFQNDTDDLQLSIFLASGASSSIIRNAGKATSRGLELEAMWEPSDTLRLQASYAYLEGEYDKFMDAGVNAAKNRAVIHSPKNSLNLLADGRILRTSWGDLRALLDYSWTDDYYAYPYQLASSGPLYNPLRAVAGDTLVRSYGVLNARLALSDIAIGNGQAEVALWSRNITDEEHINNYTDFGPGFGSLTDAYYIEPRTYGLALSVKW